MTGGNLPSPDYNWKQPHKRRVWTSHLWIKTDFKLFQICFTWLRVKVRIFVWLYKRNVKNRHTCLIMWGGEHWKWVWSRNQTAGSLRAKLHLKGRILHKKYTRWTKIKCDTIFFYESTFLNTPPFSQDAMREKSYKKKSKYCILFCPVSEGLQFLWETEAVCLLEIIMQFEKMIHQCTKIHCACLHPGSWAL